MIEFCCLWRMSLRWYPHRNHVDYLFVDLNHCCLCWIHLWLPWLHQYSFPMTRIDLQSSYQFWTNLVFSTLTVIELEANDGLLLKKLYADTIGDRFKCFSVALLSSCSFSSSTVSLPIEFIDICRLFALIRWFKLVIELTEARFPWLFVARMRPLQMINIMRKLPKWNWICVSYVWVYISCNFQ